MGGAFVATADDATALWANPAGLAGVPGISGVAASLFGAGVASNRNEFTGIVDHLASIDLAAIAAGHDLGEIPRIFRDLSTLAQPGTGVVGSGVAGLSVGKGGLAIGIGDVAYGAVYPTLDLVHILPGNDPDTGLVFNQTGISLVGLEAREARLGYATPIFTRMLVVGGALRYIRGRTYFARQLVFDAGDSDPAGLIRDAFRDNARDTNKFAFDAGAMLDLAGKVRLGIVSAALNEPEFDVARVAGAPRTVRLPRTLRAGVSVTPIGVLTVAADYDLSQTDTLQPGGRSRQLSAGVEWKLPFFAVRAGAFRDSAAPDPHWSYTAGLGIGTKSLSLDAALSFSSDGVSLSSTKRRDVGAGLGLRLRL